MINDDDEFSAILEIYYDSLRFSGNSTRLPRTRISFLYSFFFFSFFLFYYFIIIFFFYLIGPIKADRFLSDWERFANLVPSQVSIYLKILFKLFTSKPNFGMLK